MRIDAHQHFWSLGRGDYNWLTPDLTPIYRDFTPADLKPLLTQHAFDGTILVQAADTDAETDFLLELADKHDWILGVVGWVDLELPTAVERLHHLSKHPKFVGVRPMIQDIDDDNWMLRPNLAPAIQALIELDLRFDALLKPRHLKPFMTFFKAYPNLRIVIDHCAKPEIRNEGFQPWAEQLSEIAVSSGCYCKISGLVTEASDTWAIPEIIPYAAHVLKVFGPERVIFGSDWPVLNLAGEYSAWVRLGEQVCDPESHNKLFGENAAKFYFG